MARHCMLLAVVMHVSLWQTSLTHRTGAPSSRCEDMTPGHGTEQAGANPYSLDIGSVTTYTPGTPIQVTVRGGMFKGILLQVRLTSETTYQPIGWFTAPDGASSLKTLICNNIANSAITHSSDTDKSNSVLTWNPPNNDVGEIEFVATVNQERFTWWMNVKTDALNYTAPQTMETMETSEPTRQSTTEDAMESNNASHIMYFVSAILCGLLSTVMMTKFRQ